MRILCLVITALIGINPVLAQPRPSNEARADQYTEAAIAAQKSGDYDTAIDLYQKANALVPNPEFVYDIAQAHRLAWAATRTPDPPRAATHRDAARDYYARFLATKPSDEKEELIAQGWLGKLDKLWAEEHPKEEAARRAVEDRKAEEAIRVEQARLAAERRKQAERDAIEHERIASAVAKTRIESETSKARTVKLSGGAAFGAGVVAVGIGVYFGFKAKQISDDLTKGNVFEPSRISDGQQADRYMAIACISGGALLVGGVVTYWIGRRIGDVTEKPAVSIGIAPAQRSGSLLIRGSF